MSPVRPSIPASARTARRASASSSSNAAISRRLSPRRRTSSPPSVISLADASKRFSKQQHVRRRRATFSPKLRYSRDDGYTDHQTSSQTSSESMEEYSDFSDASSQYSASSPHPLASSSLYKPSLPRELRTCDELDLVFGSIAGDWFSWLTPEMLNASASPLRHRTSYASPTESNIPSDSRQRSLH
ncbi:hypothetical protein CYLTODRAFT_486339 [Cylindrobasidium torrendii FP15055 ss-10]|uniref:Uncharacterized protein n=1 Tax=Cylindrobasidium torrendii FP15055 ss-10 TaxID=1314674 RepID=A0A0D7BSC5_9AGAR|nr:hypothetical protein CYLTODRAFT_486339 [Cylindrobasidium torrendii FP15055 ss-10]